MIAYAEHEFSLSALQADGATLRDHLTLAKSQGEDPEQLNGPEFPDGAEYLWGFFNELRNRVGGTGFGPSPISHTEIDAWMRITGTNLYRWELEIICSLDDAYLRQAASESKKRNDNRHRDPGNQG